MDQQSKQKRPYFYNGQEKLRVLWSYLGYKAKVSYERTQRMFNLVNTCLFYTLRPLPHSVGHGFKFTSAGSMA